VAPPAHGPAPTPAADPGQDDHKIHESQDGLRLDKQRGGRGNNEL